MGAAGIVLIVLGVIALLILAYSVRIVRQSKAVVIERLGKYSRTYYEGIHFVAPFIDRVGPQISLKEMVADFAPQAVITRDNVTMQIDTVVYFQVTDPKLFTYGVEQPMNAIENLTATTLRNIVGEMELDETLTSRDTVNQKIWISDASDHRISEESEMKQYIVTGMSCAACQARVEKAVSVYCQTVLYSVTATHSISRKSTQG